MEGDSKGIDCNGRLGSSPPHPPSASPLPRQSAHPVMRSPQYLCLYHLPRLPPIRLFQNLQSPNCLHFRKRSALLLPSPALFQHSLVPLSSSPTPSFGVIFFSGRPSLHPPLALQKSRNVACVTIPTLAALCAPSATSFVAAIFIFFFPRRTAA